MKTPCLLAALLMTVASVTAQPPPDAPPPPPRGEALDPGGGRDARRPLDRWMVRMRDQHPAEYERLMHLQEQDPEAFRAELRVRRDQLRNRNLEEGMEEMPRIREVMEGMPPEERDRMAERFSRMVRSQSQRPTPATRQINAGERKSQDLARAYREAPEGEREAILAQLRAQVEEVFVLREEHHQRQIEEAEKNLTRLKNALDSRREHRGQIVERRLQELTRGGPTTR